MEETIYMAGQLWCGGGLGGRWRWWKELRVSGEWDGGARAHAEQGWGWLMGMN